MSIINGNKYVFNTTESGLKKYNGTEVEIIRALTDKEVILTMLGICIRLNTMTDILGMFLRMN